MENFRALYFEYCKNYNVEPQEIVKAEFKRLANVSDDSARVLNLSSHHLSDRTCMILGKLLAHDQTFHTLQLNECSLTNEALRELCNALTTNNTIKVLELRGNNIHGDGTNSLAKLLRQNISIKMLSLEWNSMGLMDTHAFPAFCESIAINKSLTDLDLRNNQITHTSAAEMATALEKNTSLKNLDFRWNSVGLVGGKALLNSLKRNHTLTQLLLVGNNIPEDILESINVAISRNNDKARTVNDFNMRTTVLTKEIQNIQLQKDKQINLLLNKMDLNDEAGRKMNIAFSEKMKKLQNVLDDRSSTMNAIASKLSMTEADLALSEQKCNDLSHTLERLRLEKENEIQLLNSKAKRDKEDLIGERAKFEKELNESIAQNLKLNDKIKELERKCAEATSNMYDAKEKLAQGQAEYQIKMAVLDEESRRLKQKHKEELKEFEINKGREITRIKEENEITEKNLKDRINKLELIKHGLEDEVNHLKATISTMKVTHEQEMQELKSRSQLEEMQKLKDIEDKLRNIQKSKEDAEMRYNQQNATILDMQQKNYSLTLEIETMKRNNDSLRAQLSEKETEIIESLEKLKTDHTKRIRSIQKDIDRVDELKENTKSLELKLKDEEANHRRETKEFELKITELQEKLKMKEAEFERYRNQEEQRDLRLQTIFQSFMKELHPK